MTLSQKTDLIGDTQQLRWEVGCSEAYSHCTGTTRIL